MENHYTKALHKVLFMIPNWGPPKGTENPQGNLMFPGLAGFSWEHHGGLGATETLGGTNKACAHQDQEEGSGPLKRRLRPAREPGTGVSGGCPGFHPAACTLGI